jgi:hypothetical protein
MKKILRYILILIAAPLGCLIFALIFIALFSLEFYGYEIEKYIIEKYIASNTYILIGLAIFFFIVFISTRPNE